MSILSILIRTFLIRSPTPTVWMPKPSSNSQTHCGNNTCWTQATIRSDADLHVNPNQVQQVAERFNATHNKQTNPGLWKGLSTPLCVRPRRGQRLSSTTLGRESCSQNITIEEDNVTEAAGLQVANKSSSPRYFRVFHLWQSVYRLCWRHELVTSGGGWVTGEAAEWSMLIFFSFFFFFETIISCVFSAAVRHQNLW